MKYFRATSGPFDLQYRFTPEEIDQACCDALAKEKMLPSSPEAIRIDRFIEKHFKISISYERLDPNVLGCTLFSANGAVKHMVISDQLDDGTAAGERRLRSTLAHEAGHGIFHSLLFMPSLDQGRPSFPVTDIEQVDLKQRRILCRNTDVNEGAGERRPYDGRWWEWQANRAISGFLLPVRLVRLALTSLLDQSPVSGIQSLSTKHRDQAVSQVVDIFDVNPVVARIRLGELYPDTGGRIES